MRAGSRVKRIVDGTDKITTVHVAGMEIEYKDIAGSDVEQQRTLYYPGGGAFRVIEATDTIYGETELYFSHGDHPVKDGRIW